jgi:hypothetical protein
MARKSKDSELREVWQGAAAAVDDGLRALVQRVVQLLLATTVGLFRKLGAGSGPGCREG